MLTIYDDSPSRGSLSRRELLRVGTAAIGGLTLGNLLTARVARAGSDFVKDRSVVVLNLQGGPTQFELFDPKMDAPREIRTITGEIPTTLPGVTFGGTLPKLARLAHRMAVVRSSTVCCWPSMSASTRAIRRSSSSSVMLAVRRLAAML